MAQVVNAEAVAEPGAAAGGQEDGAPPVGQADDAAAGHGEDELVSVLSVGGRREFGGDEPWNRDGPGLVRFGGAEDDMAADVGEGAPDIDAAALEVDVADPQCGGFAPAQPV
jgi:hypothetical protein